MLQKVLQAILRRYFGQFLTGLQNVELAFWTGRINIKSASFKHDKINELIRSNNLPFSIKYSYIGSLDIDIPWNKLSSAPVQMVISDVFIVLKLQGVNFGEGQQNNQNAKLLLIKKYTQYLIKKSAELNMESSSSDNTGYLNKLVIKILHNMNVKIKNISFRIQNQGSFNKDVHIRRDSDEFDQVEGMSKNQNEKIPQKRRSSGLKARRRSSAVKVSDKPFALGFCIEDFVSFTVDQNGNRRFINVDQQSAKFSKKNQLHQISLYWQEDMKENLYKKTSEQKNSYIRSLITRKQHRLLTIDGTVILKKNFHDKRQGKQFTYFLSSSFKELSIQSNYEQLTQMLIVYKTVKAQNEKRTILKLKELQKKQQIKLQMPFKQHFRNYLYKNKFVLSAESKNKEELKKITEITDIINGIQKRLLMKWSKQQVIQIIKKEKKQSRLKEKNKKGWFSFLSQQQSEIPLDEGDEEIIQKQIQAIIMLTEQSQIKSFINDLFIENLQIKLRHKGQFQDQQMVLFMEKFSTRYVKNGPQKKVQFGIQNLGFDFNDYKTKHQTSIFKLSTREQSVLKMKRNESQLSEMSDEQNQSNIDSENHAVKFLWHKLSKNNESIYLSTDPLVIKHEIKVLSFLSTLMKLRHNEEQLKTDLIILKSRVESSLPDQQIEMHSVCYNIDIDVRKVEILIEVSQQSYINFYVENIGVSTTDKAKNKHKIVLSNLGLKYVKSSIKMRQQGKNQGRMRRVSQINEDQIINDLSLHIDTIGLKNIVCEIPQFNVNLCQQDLNHIYLRLKQQAQTFSSQKKQFKKQKLMEQVFYEGKVEIMNTFRVKKTYLAALYFQSLALYSLKKDIETLQQLFLNENETPNPYITMPLGKLRVTKIQQKQLKFQSLLVNQIIQFESQIDANLWLQNINRRIFQFRAKTEMYKLIDQFQQLQSEQRQKQKFETTNQEQFLSPSYKGQMSKEQKAINEIKKSSKILYQYESQIVLKIKAANILYSRNKVQSVLSLHLQDFSVKLQQDNFKYKRQIKVQYIELINCKAPKGSLFGKLISNKCHQQFADNQLYDREKSNQITIVLSGKKKLHPNYTGQLSLQTKIQSVMVNFDTEIIYMLIEKIAWQTKYTAYNEQQRDQRVLQLFKDMLENPQILQIQQKVQKSHQMDDNANYIDVDRFKKMFTCLILLKIRVNLDFVTVNLINGRTNHVMFNAKAKKIQANIDKGQNVFFIKAKLNSFMLNDLTGYPKTNKQKWKVSEQPYNLISTQMHRKNNYVLQFNFSSFPAQSFINKNRFKSFIVVKLYDLQVNYQHQPIMRFIDYLTNQIIIFFMEPHSLHKFNEKVRGPYRYQGDIYYREDQIQQYIENIVRPFFNQMTIAAEDLVLHFNTFPNQESIMFKIPKISVQTENRFGPQRIQLNVPQLIAMQNKQPLFKQLAKNMTFNEKILRNQWSNRLNIKIESISTNIIKQKFNFEMYFERCLHSQKEFLLPCLKIKKDLIQQAAIKNLTLVAPKQVYNLINKCMMFNTGYDDELDHQYITNIEHQHKVQMSELLFKIQIAEFTMLIPQLNETAIVIEQMCYKFIRYPDMLKEMGVNGKALHILGKRTNFIVPIEYKEQKGLQYIIEMKQNGEKSMSTFLRGTQIIYDWALFSQLLQYFLLDDSCYPPQTQFPDLPQITCHFYLLDSYVRLIKTQTHYYALNGDIAFTWIRMKQPHPQTYRLDRQLFPIGKQGSVYLAKIKECHLRKFKKKHYQNDKLMNYRVLSHPISIDMKWSNIMKVTPLGHQYTDFVIDYGIKYLFLKLSYVDIQDIQNAFFKKAEPVENAVLPPPLPYVPFAQHLFSIQKLTIQIGVSQLPVPLLDITFEGKATIQMIGSTTAINLEINNLTSKYWNMMIGRWQPILEKLTANSNLKFSENSIYAVFDSPGIIYLDISMDSIKVLNLISNDFKNKGVLNLFKKEEISDGLNISPYVITNRTSFTIMVSNPVIVPAIVPNNEKVHLQTRFLENIDQFMGTIMFKFEDDPTQYEIDLNISAITKFKIKYKGIEYQLFLRPVSNSIVKQIIITSPYVLSNKTSFKLEVTLHNKVYSINPKQKIALPFYQLVDNKQFKINFPHLNKHHIKQNYPFMLKDIQKKGYEHYINLEGEQFNCAFALKKQYQNGRNKQANAHSNLQAIEGQTYIEVTPVYNFKNLLPLDVFIQFNIRSQKTNTLIPIRLQVNQQSQIYDLNTSQDIFMRLKLKGYHFSQFIPLSKSQDPNYLPTFLMLHDHRALEGKIKIKILQQGKRRKVYFYCEAVLINETTHDLFTFHQGNLLSGQKVNKIAQSATKYTLIDAQTQKQFSYGFNQDDPYRSTDFDIIQLGRQQIQMLKADQFYELTIHNTLQCLDQQAEIYCNVLRTLPKYIIINSCSRILQFRQYNTEKIVNLMPNQRAPWVWISNNQKHQFCFRPVDNEISMESHDWRFSSSLDFDLLEDTVMVLRPTNPKQDWKLLIKIQVFKELQQNFIQFKEIISHQNVVEDFYVFHNELKLARIQFCQSILRQQSREDELRPFRVSPGDTISFGWDHPQQSQKIYVMLQFLGPLKSKFKKESFEIDVKQKGVIEKRIQNLDGEELQIQFVIETRGLKKRIKVRQRNQSQIDNFLNMGGNKIGISMHQVGISLINSGKNRKQILYLSMKKFQIILMEESQLRKIQVKVKYVSIDNNSNHNTIYPVLLTPLKHQKTLTKNRPFFVMLMETNIKQQKSITEIKQFRICLEPISLKIHDQMLVKLSDMYKQITSSQEKKNIIDLNKVFRSYFKKFQWQEIVLKKQEHQVFFREFEIAKLAIQISFSIRPKINQGNYLIFTILSSFGVAISNVSESQLTLSRFFKKEITLTQLQTQLSDFYVKQFIKGVYKILGSINIFGNPYVFVRLLGEGAWEVVNQPTEGFIKGPIEGTIGIAKGGIFFTRNIVAGTFNSFEAISQSLSRGVSYLTLDQKFIQRRQKIKIQKSNHLIQGFANGMFAIYTGFEVAVTGLVRHPVQGYRKDGISSGFTGALTGIAGLVTKPISGIFGGVSKISEGIKNTALLFQDGPNNKRARHPRVFISQQQYYANYNHLQSYTIAFLQHLSTKYLNIQILFISVTENSEDNIMKSLVLTDRFLLIVDLVEKKVQTQITIPEIRSIEIKEDIIVIETQNQEEILIEQETVKCQQLIQAFKKLRQFS